MFCFLNNCAGCFVCWTKTPGVCVFQDDRRKINTDDSDIVLCATPLYRDNVSGLLKNFMDRGISSVNPLMEKDKNNEAVHPAKRKINIIAMANSGHPGQANFDVLKICKYSPLFRIDKNKKFLNVRFFVCLCEIKF